MRVSRAARQCPLRSCRALHGPHPITPFVQALVWLLLALAAWGAAQGVEQPSGEATEQGNLTLAEQQFQQALALRCGGASRAAGARHRPRAAPGVRREQQSYFWHARLVLPHGPARVRKPPPPAAARPLALLEPQLAPRVALLPPPNPPCFCCTH